MSRTLERTEAGELDPEITDADVYVLGGGAVGATIVRRLRGDDRAVALVDDSIEPEDIPVHRADPTDFSRLAEAGLESASIAIVATPCDSRNLLAAQLASARFDVDRIVVRTNEPDRVDLMADAGLDPVCATTALASALIERV